jgi:hypothetical protein
MALTKQWWDWKSSRLASVIVSTENSWSKLIIPPGDPGGDDLGTSTLLLLLLELPGTLSIMQLISFRSWLILFNAVPAASITGACNCHFA